MVTRSILPQRLAGAVARRRDVHLVGPVDLTLEGTGLTVVLGPNGAGKTSLLRLMHGLETPRAGRVTWAVPAEKAREAQAFVFQRPVMMRRSVVDSIAYPLMLHGTSKTEARARARDLAAKVGLGALTERPATALSGGEQQKLSLARALIRAPQVLFLDEPCTNLDGRSTREIEAILVDARATGTRIVMATHDKDQARRLADEVWFVLGGRLHEVSPADAFFSRPSTDAARAFLDGEIVG